MNKCFFVFLRHICLGICIIAFIVACQSTEKQRKLRIIHAGSVSVPLAEIVDSFISLHSDVVIETEAWGSKAGARRIADLQQPCDVFVSADYKVIDRILIPDHASWNIPFASNEMALVYTNKSGYSAEINTENWMDILMKPDIIFGRSDPNSDPCGSRAVLCIKLAEKYYNRPGLSEQMLSLHLNQIRPKETDLLALLEKDAIDYIFLYKSVAIQHQLKFLELPDEINLSNSELDSLYNTVTVEVAGNSPEKKITETGEAMVYGITIPLKTTQKELAEEFVDFFLNYNQGLKIFEKHGQLTIVPSKTQSYANIPERLKKYALPPR
ncbi:MAG: substrate-binding domain-containing protein [Bacteroidales bacterium]|nr:substrate-binding domain-containing protein [Bacteroidales bacterium]HOY38790.1 substrate-binding domain-containing protein [Bacteroidales bacterium]HQP03987.1 substrate-binding domain-containing protein [Bacteroidales bacterium]